MRCPACGHDNIDGLDACETCHETLMQLEPGEMEMALSQAIRNEPVAILEPAPALSVAPTTPVSEVVRLMAEKNIGCVLVVWADALLGIFSERDVLRRIGDRYRELAQEPIRHFMTPAPETLTMEDSIAFALNRMDINDFRHLPIEQNERVAGIISVRDVLAYITGHFPEFAIQGN